MNSERIFSLGNVAVLPGWIILLFFPRWRWGARLISGAVIPALVGATYTYLMVVGMPGSEGGFGSIEEVRTFFADDALLTAGWLHYLAFDLFIGAWMVRDGQAQSINHLMVFPCLLLTFMFGPIGLLAYLGVRGVLRRKLWLGSATDAAPSPA